MGNLLKHSTEFAIMGIKMGLGPMQLATASHLWQCLLKM